MWVQVALFVASLVISYLLQPKPQKQKPAAFEDFDFPTADDGTPQTVVFGDVWLTDWTVIGVGNYRNSTIVAKQKGLFGSQKADAGFRYYMSIHMGLSRAIDDLIEIQIADRSIWKGNISDANISTISINQPDIFGGDKGEGGIAGQLKICKGASDQPVLTELANMYGTITQSGYYKTIPDGYYENKKVWVPPVIDPATVPAYRGVVTFFYDGLICSNSPYPKPWSFRVRRTVSGWDGSVWYPEKAMIWLSNNTIKAMNAAHILYEVQTNRHWGRGFSESQLDLESYKKVADQLFSEGFGICLAWKRQESLSEFIQQIINQIGGAHFVDRSTGLWKLVLIRDDYNVESLDTYSSSSGILRIEDDNNASNDLVTNQTVVTYRDPISNQDKPIRAENLAAIQKNGAILESKTYSGIPTADLAGRLAARDMKIAQSGLKKFKLVLNRRAYAIQPASVFKIAIPERGITSMVVRAIRVEHDVITNGEITVTVLQDVFGLPATNYIQEQPPLWQPPSYQAVPVVRQLAYEVPYSELLQSFSALELSTLKDQCYVGVVAKQPSSLQLNYQLWAKKTTDQAYQSHGYCDFSFVSAITQPVSQSATASVCVLAELITSDLQVGVRGFLGNEIVKIESVDTANNSITVARGCIDTAPVAHPVGTEFYCYSESTNASNKAFETNKSIDLKLTPRTSQNELNIAQATQVGFITVNRKERPYVPSNVRLNNQFFPAQVNGDVAFSWTHRNRLKSTDQITWLEQTTTAEEGTNYNIKITDANQSVLLNEQQVPGQNLIWNVPKIFDGELVEVLNVAMTGANNSQAFTDTSANAFTVKNFNSIIKTDASAVGGSSVMLDIAMLKTQTEASKLNIYNDDHCIEFSVKTASASDYLGSEPNTLYLGIEHDRKVSENISTLYKFISIQAQTNTLTISLNGTVHEASWIGTDKSVACNVAGLNSNQYYDVAIQTLKDGTVTVEGAIFTKFMVTIYINGIARVTDYLHVLEHGYPCSVKLNLSPNYKTGSFVAINALRITKRAGGRYSANYTPVNFPVGSSDPYWSNVVLLVTMNGSNGQRTFTDVSTNAVAVSATEAITIRTDATARGGSSAYFYFCMLMVEPNEKFDLRGKSFLISGRVKGSGEIFQLTDSISLKVDFYQLVLTNVLGTNLLEQQTVVLDHTFDLSAYFDFKIMRDAGTGQTMLWMNNIKTSALFNPWKSTGSSALHMGLFNRDIITLNKSYFNGLKIATASEGSGLIPNVVNPVTAEISAVRDGLASYDKVVVKFDVVS